eukprot:6243211-Prymnesium_polylepis.1
MAAWCQAVRARVMAVDVCAGISMAASPLSTTGSGESTMGRWSVEVVLEPGAEVGGEEAAEVVTRLGVEEGVAALLRDA